MSDGPINYNAAITPANPMAAFQQGFGLSQGIQQTFDARAAAEAQARQQAETEALRQKVVSGMATGAERADFLTRLAPEQTKAYQGALEGMDKEVLKTKATQLGKINAAFASGNQEVAIGLMQDQADALRGAGDDEGAKLLDNAIKIEQTQPGQGQFYVGSLLSLMGKEGQDILDSSNKNLAAPGDRAKTAAETAKMLADLASLNDGKLTPEQKFAQETKLREEATTKSAKYNESGRILNNMIVSSNSANGPGDYALVTSFLKMLDPTSVVRESEFAQAQDTSGAFNALIGKLTKFKDGSILPAETRKAYVELAQKYYEEAKKKRDSDFKLLGKVVENYGLNKENIFSEDTKTADLVAKGGR